MEKHIELMEGDSLVVYAVSRTPPPPPEPEDDLEILLVITPVSIYANKEGTYVKFISDLDVCTDGSGSSHGDPYYQPQTAYWNGGEFLNADEDKYIVVPPQVRSMVVPTVMGCMGRVTNMETGVVSDGVVGDIGPKSKTGECAYCLAKVLNPSVTANSGDTKMIYLYELFPGKAAVVDGKKYALEPA